MTIYTVAQQFHDALVNAGLLTPEQIKMLQRGDVASVKNMLSLEQHGDEETLYRSLAAVFEINYVDLTGFAIPKELFSILPATKAQQLEVVPYKFVANELYVVTSDPFKEDLNTILENITNYPVQLFLSTRAGITNALKSGNSSSTVLQDISEDFKPVIVRETDEGNERTISLESNDASLVPIVKLINTVLMAALQRRASDIHIESYNHGVVVKYRIDGVLYPAIEPLDYSHHASLISRIKVMSDLDIAEKRIPQDGRFKLRLADRDVDFRVSVLPSIFGEDVVIRVLDQAAVTDGIDNLRLDRLDMEPATLKKFRRAIHEPYGMVLITGPTGSGKTTTLYAAMLELNNGEEKMITIEDPVEYQLDGIVQIPVNEKKQLTFAKGLRSILRHDPDKIMVGEIRDSETAQIAVQSALTGHLVFTTVHANNAFDVISRFSNMGIDVHSFVGSLNCVLAQRLVRKICLNCKKPMRISQEEKEISGLSTEDVTNHQWYEGEGCDQCSNTGFKGRTIIVELLELSPKIREMILARKTVGEMLHAAREEGMTTLRESALALGKAGQTSLREINRITFVD